VKAALRDIRRINGPFTTVIADVGAMAAQARADHDPPDNDSGPTDPPEGADDRAANLEALQRLAHDYAALVPNPQVSGFIAWLTTSTGGDETASSDAVEIATFHAAKGLEWPVVHLAGLEDGLVPIGHAKAATDQAEERRLFYVAVTRAEQQLYCTWAGERTFGERAVTRRRSPFVDEAELAGVFGGPPRKPPATGGGTPGAATSRRARGSRDGRRQVPDGPDAALHERLRQWRSDRARTARAPAYTVFNDDTLDDLVRTRPSSVDQLLMVRGIGPVKVSRFGDELLALIAADD